VFKMNFPIMDARENFLLEFVEYYVEKPKYSVRECEERCLTYAVPIKAKLRLSQKAEEGKGFVNTIEQDVYLGNLPTMTSGTFIINGAERVVVASSTARRASSSANPCIRTGRRSTPRASSRSAARGWSSRRTSTT
jgi:DNA-directed RNA polymerase beta subunit